MKLSDILMMVPESDIKISRDGEFSHLGLISKEGMNQKLAYLTSTDYLGRLYNNVEISAVVTNEDIASQIDSRFDGGILLSKSPELTFYTIHNYLARKSDFYEIDMTSTRIGINCSISECSSISPQGVIIGDNVVIEPGVVIFSNVRIGNNCYIGANTTIGGRGFQIYHKDDSSPFYVDHVGGVIIEDDVDVFPQTRIASGLFTPTILRNHSKIDAMVQIGHSAEIGRETLITGGSIICGSASIGKKCWIGAGTIIKNSVTIGDNAFLCIGSVVVGNVPEDGVVSGNYAIDHKKHMKRVLMDSLGNK